VLQCPSQNRNRGMPAHSFRDCTESHRRNEGIYTLTLPSIIPRFPYHLEMNSLHPMPFSKNRYKQLGPIIKKAYHPWVCLQSQSTGFRVGNLPLKEKPGSSPTRFLP